MHVQSRARYARLCDACAIERQSSPHEALWCMRNRAPRRLRLALTLRRCMPSTCTAPMTHDTRGRVASHAAALAQESLLAREPSRRAPPLAFVSSNSCGVAQL